jgi:hypothetical protein
VGRAMIERKHEKEGKTKTVFVTTVSFLSTETITFQNNGFYKELAGQLSARCHN